MVPGKFNLYKLNQVIQTAMGWTNSHLHQFIIDGERYSIPDVDDEEPVIDERLHTLSQIAPYKNYKFLYEYDFGDNWEHDVVVEKILTNITFALCLEGERACPPEDVGGTGGYKEFLKAIKDPDHEEHDSCLLWVGGKFDPEQVDFSKVNRALMRVK
jgi:hypothetical protein